MKKLLTWFLAGLIGLAIFNTQPAEGQITKKQADIVIGSSEAAVAGKIYTPLPDPPAQGVESTTTLVAATVGSSVTSAEMGGNRWGLVETNFTNTLRANNLPPIGGEFTIFKSISDTEYSIVGGPTLTTGTTIFHQTGTVSDSVGFYHMIGLGHSGVASLRGASWTGKAGGSNAVFSDLILANTQSPSIQFNGDGDAGTYGTMVVQFVRGIGDPTANEVFYFGDTSPSGFGIVDSLYAWQLFGYNKGWDGLQMNSIRGPYVGHWTIYHVGTENDSGQKSSLQMQNVGNGALVENFIAVDAPKAFQIAARDFTLRNGVFINDEEGFHQDVVDDAGYASGDVLSDSLGNAVYEGIHFYTTTPRAFALQLNERYSNIYFVNCTVGEGITDFYDDQRDTPTGSIYEYNTTMDAAYPGLPQFNSLVYTNKDHGLVTSDWYYYKGMGYRTPDIDYNRPTITDITPDEGEATDVITITGTNFEDVTNVTVGNTEVTDFDVNSSTEIEATIAASPSGKVRVITEHGMAVSSQTFTYSSFNPFADIAWVGAFSADQFDTGTSTWPNNGTGGDGVLGGATIVPTKAVAATKSGQGLVFVNASGTGLQYGTGTVNEPFETWIEIITAASFTSTQRIYANGTATRLTILNTGALSVAGTADVATGVTLAANTYYVIRIVNNGASSSVTVNNGTPTTFTITAQNGSSTPKIGHAYAAGSGHWNGTYGSFFQKATELSAGEITAMWTYFGF